MQGTLETWVQWLGVEDLWRRKWLPNPVFLPGESHGQRSLAGYSPLGSKELDMTEAIQNARKHLYTLDLWHIRFSICSFDD